MKKGIFHTNKKTFHTKKRNFLLLGLAAILTLLAGCTMETEEYADFDLDTSENVNLNVYGYLENFPSISEVIDGFEKLYPNCRVTYESLDSYAETVNVKLREDTKNTHLYLMSSDVSSLLGEDISKYALDYLDEANQIRLDDINMDATAYEITDDGKLYGVPMMLNMRGMCVNIDLLSKYGLSVPQNWTEFLNACKVLKEAGMIPIQGAANDVASCLIYTYYGTSVVHDTNYENILAETNAFLEGSGKYAGDSFEKWITLCKPENAYYSYEECMNLDSNYDPAILNFFEGDVAFFPCIAETFSGMKKRETAENSKYNGFKYEYVGVPMGDAPSVYWMTWTGISVNPQCEYNNWARAFAQYILKEKNLNLIAKEKGMPANTKHWTDETYQNVINIKPPYMAYSTQFEITYYKYLRYTYEKIFKLDDRIFVLEDGETCREKAIAYYEGKIKDERK